MIRKFLLGFLLITPVLQDCGRMMVSAVTAQMEHSKYSPAITSADDIDKQFAMVDLINKQVVSDEIGTHYYERVGTDGLYTVTIRKDDEVVLKKLFNGAIGLMEPVYTFAADGYAHVDWQLTQQRYDFLTKTVNLKLLPIEFTKQYHQLGAQFVENEHKNNLAKWNAIAAGQAQAQAGLLEMISASITPAVQETFSGNGGLNAVLYAFSKIPQQFQFIVHGGGDGGGGMFFSQYQQQLNKEYLTKMGVPQPPTDDSLSAATMRHFYINSSNITFVPIDFYKTVNSGSAYRQASGCYYSNKTDMKELMNFSNEVSDIPYVSGIAYVIKTKTASYKNESKARFLKALKNDIERRKQAEQACLVGLKALDVSGAIESRRLK